MTIINLPKDTMHQIVLKGSVIAGNHAILIKEQQINHKWLWVEYVLQFLCFNFRNEPLFQVKWSN